MGFLNCLAFLIRSQRLYCCMCLNLLNRLKKGQRAHILATRNYFLICLDSTTETETWSMVYGSHMSLADHCRQMKTILLLVEAASLQVLIHPKHQLKICISKIQRF